MRIVHLSYVVVKEYKDPEAWLRRIDFFVLLMEKMSLNHQVISVHCINYSGTLMKGNVEYHFFQRKGGRLSTAYKLNNYVKNLRPDVIIIHGMHFPLQVFSLIQTLSRNVPIIIQHHAEKPLKHYKAILHSFIDPRVDAYFFTSREQSRPWITERLIASHDKIFEIMEVPSVFIPIDRQTSQRVTGVTDKLSYLWVGRFDENKDPFTLVNAFAAFAKSSQRGTLYIIFRGEYLLREIEEALKGYKIKDRIILVGEVSHVDMLYWYNSCDFIISTSHYEGSGVSVAEGLSCGCIPILTSIPSFDKMTDSNSFGRFFEAGNADQLLKALMSSLNINIVSEREKVLSYYQSNLSADAISSSMLAVCEQVINIRSAQ